MMKHKMLLPMAGLALLATQVSVAQTDAPRKITTPKESIGFNIGDDYHMANYVQLTKYWQTLAKESDRMKLVNIGPTSEGRPQWMAIISSPENLAKMDHYREISEKLARAEGVSEEDAHKLAQEGKSIIWIDGGLHAAETVGSQQLIETVYALNSKTDSETLRLLNDDIVLCVLDNPDGMDLVADWYMREPVPEKRGMARNDVGTPRLWHKYIGHDDNRDFYMNNMLETTNISRILFRSWYPQIMYNHHQTGPEGAVIFMPPFRDPFNYHFDPLIVMKIQAVGTAMHERLIEEDKPGSGMRSAANYSTWYNGGLRTVTYFHNMTGLLTEIIGAPTPITLPLVPSRQLGTNDLPYPAVPQVWHYRQSIDYELTNNYAVLDYASREKEHLLFDTWRMGKNSIDRGNKDAWTVTPKRITAVTDAAVKMKASNKADNPYEDATTAPTELYTSILHDPKMRDPRGYIITSDQPDFPTATKFVNALMKSGVDIQQATSEFTVAGKSYPKGSYVILCNQAYRPHILDMFEPQDHPNDFAYPGGPPVRPYDATGWTLAYQMGVQFDRELEGFTGPFQKISTDLAKPITGIISGPAKPAGYLVSHSYNDAFTLTNRLLKANQKVYWLGAKATVPVKTTSTGTLWIPYTPDAQKLLESAAKELGINATAVTARPTGEALQLHAEKIGLYDQYGGLMPSGWIRWLFEQFEFPFDVIHPQVLDAGGLKSKYDAIVFSDAAISLPGRDSLANNRNSQPAAETIPAEFRPWLGTITRDKTVPQLQKFVEEGGTILAIGSSSAGIYDYLKLPITSAETELVKGKVTNLSGEKFYIPGTLLRTQVNTENPVAYGMPEKVDVFFDRSPAFKLNPDASIKGVQTIAWYGSGDLLDSGWAWGQQYLNNTVAVAQANVGKGKVLLFGPEVTFRGQPHSTFKFLFNGLLFGPATSVDLK